jgi:MFS family permease
MYETKEDPHKIELMSPACCHSTSVTGKGNEDTAFPTDCLESSDKVGFAGNKRRTPAFYLAIAAICSCSFLSAMDTVIVASALPRISEELHSTSVEAYWCGTAFVFAETVTQPIYGALTGIVGMKACVMAGMSIFLVASILCATAQSMGWLIAARTVQGMGGGGVDAMVIVLISALVPLEERGTYVGIISLSGAVGLVSGVVLGAAIAERSTWRL